MKHLTQRMIVHNSGQDLWDYLFENQKLRNYEVDSEKSEEDFIMESEMWMAENLLEGEDFAWYIAEDGTQNTIITNYCRIINMKKREFRRCQYYSKNTIQTSINEKVVNIVKWIKENMGDVVEYEYLPDESKQHITLYLSKKNGSKGFVYEKKE